MQTEQKQITIGDTFSRDGAEWRITSIKHETNKRFKWDEVMAEWTGHGPMPLWHKEPRRFFLNRIRLSDGHRYF
jgi:hypothetical protein